MARIKVNTIVSDIVGSIGGTTFSNTRAGLVMKNKINRRSVNSTSQQLCNNVMFTCQQAWLGLTTAQRSQWDYFANFYKVSQKGDKSRILNGHELFLKINFYRVTYGHSIFTDSQFIKYDSEPIICGLSLSGSDLHLVSSRTMVSSSEFIFCQVTPRMKISVFNPSNRYRTIVFSTTNSDTFDISTPYYNIFGYNPQAGDTLFLRYTVISLYNAMLNPIKTAKCLL